MKLVSTKITADFKAALVRAYSVAKEAGADRAVRGALRQLARDIRAKPRSGKVDVPAALKRAMAPTTKRELRKTLTNDRLVTALKENAPTRKKSAVKSPAKRTAVKLAEKPTRRTATTKRKATEKPSRRSAGAQAEIDRIQAAARKFEDSFRRKPSKPTREKPAAPKPTREKPAAPKPAASAPLKSGDSPGDWGLPRFAWRTWRNRGKNTSLVEYIDPHNNKLAIGILLGGGRSMKIWSGSFPTNRRLKVPSRSIKRIADVRYTGFENDGGEWFLKTFGDGYSVVAQYTAPPQIERKSENPEKYSKSDHGFPKGSWEMWAGRARRGDYVEYWDEWHKKARIGVLYGGGKMIKIVSCSPGSSMFSIFKVHSNNILRLNNVAGIPSMVWGQADDIANKIVNRFINSFDKKTGDFTFQSPARGKV